MRNAITRHGLGLAATLLALVAVLVSTASVSEAKGDPRVYDLRKKVLGRKVADWTAEWWQWVMSLPNSANPLVDEEGVRAMAGQRGQVWFLVGGSGAETVLTRTATIPAGKSLLIPMINVLWDQLDPSTQTEAQIRQAAATYIASVDTDSLVCTIDGVPVGGLERNRVASRAFDYAIPDDGLYEGSFEGGIYKPAVSDGYWVFVKPLPIGQHTIHCEARSGAPYNSTQNFTYVLEVVDHDQP